MALARAYLRHAARGRIALGGIQAGQGNGDRVDEIHEDGHHCGAEGAEQIQEDDRAEFSRVAPLGIGDGSGDEYEDQHRRDGLQCAYEKRAEDADPGSLRQEEAQYRADHEADQDAEDQADGIPFFDDRHVDFPPVSIF